MNLETEFNQTKNHNVTLEKKLENSRNDLIDTTQRLHETKSQLDQKEADITRALSDLTILNANLQETKSNMDKTAGILKQTQE